MPAWRLAPIALVLSLAVAGCISAQDDPRDDDDRRGTAPAPGMPACAGHDVTPTGATGGQSSVSNNPGSFSYSGQALAKTTTETHLWQNPSGAAYVMWSGQTGTGTLVLTIQDACAEEVYRREVGAGQQSGAMESTTRAMPGEWLLTFEFTAYSGQMGLQVSSS